MDERIKTQAAEALSEMGLSISDAVRVFLTRVAMEKQLPFTLKAPNADTRAAMEEADEIMRSGHSRFDSVNDMFDGLEKNSRE
jgi:DNA-damage-inducible protein J